MDVNRGSAHGWPGEVHEGECEMGFDFGGQKSLSLSLSPSLQKMSADVRIVVCAQFCYMALVVSHHF